MDGSSKGKIWTWNKIKEDVLRVAWLNHNYQCLQLAQYKQTTHPGLQNSVDILSMWDCMFTFSSKNVLPPFFLTDKNSQKNDTSDFLFVGFWEIHSVLGFKFSADLPLSLTTYFVIRNQSLADVVQNIFLFYVGMDKHCSHMASITQFWNCFKWFYFKII